jgi:steroid delta-isomerase-like uncharacterized protein
MTLGSPSGGESTLWFSFGGKASAASLHPRRQRRQLPGYDFMKPTEAIRSYIDAWNGRDAEALVAAFAEDGKFCNPHTYPGIGGEALAEFVKGVWTAFPDFHLELLNCGEIEPELVAIHWSLQGTNTGQRMEGPPTGRSVSIKGASIIRLEGERLSPTNATSIERPLRNSFSRRNSDRTRGGATPVFRVCYQFISSAD